ncbi:unnamed protein product, partial [Rotaria sordida]
MPTPINTIIDTKTAQLLKNRCDKILQRTKADMMQVYVEAAEVRANQCQFQFNNAMNKLKENESIHPSDRILTKIERDIDRFNDVFHEYGDDIDEDEDKNIDFDNLQRTIIEEEDEYNEDDDTESVVPIEELLDHGSNVILLDPTVEEDELSQKLSQLSASSEVKRTTHQEQTKKSKSRKRPALTPTTPTTTTITTTSHVV